MVKDLIIGLLNLLGANGNVLGFPTGGFESIKLYLIIIYN
jgi:hypothetical protein